MGQVELINISKSYDKQSHVLNGINQLQATKSSYATQGAVMDMIPEERKIIETALETVYNGGDVDKAYNTAVKQLNSAIEQANTTKGK
ncbi:hypothetical protein KHA93_13080 [Bacillus sp. FJAT-49732]|uniref:Uncharacterized protein n=1 Tax=Lederbergia citrisecunda TaxID=2833583 RepID=A0A942TLV2_9BACI|nr:hypothetical protein [Lederbergia citrisecunda]MBS4200565.1 hypothetical protein [Lederbergia citrisecunda]